MCYFAKAQNWLATLSALIFASAFLPAAQNDIANKLYFGSRIQINQDPGIVRVMVTDEEMIRLLNTTQFVVYPGSFLICSFYMANKTDNTLKLAPDGEALLQFLKLRYTYRNDSIDLSSDIPFKYVELIRNYPDTTLPTWGQGNKLPPHNIVSLDASVGWDDLAKLDSRIVDFHWVYDNSTAAASDTAITLAQYRGRSRGLRS